MIRETICFVLVILVITILTACAGGAPTPTAKPEPTTAEPQAPQQATAGMKIYDDHCARCHGANLEDGFAAKLSKPALVKYGTAQKVFDYIRQNMPKGNPESLSDQEYYDVTGYLLFQQGLLEPDQVVSADTASSITLSE